MRFNFQIGIGDYIIVRINMGFAEVLINTFAFLLLLTPCMASSRGDLKDKERELLTAIKTNDTNLVRQTLREIVMMNNEDAAETILDLVKRVSRLKNPNIYWELIGAAASFTDPKALEEITDFILKYDKNIGKDIMFEISNKNYSHTLSNLLIQTYKKGEDDIKIISLNHMPNVPTKELVDFLISELDDADGALKRKIAKTLELITGKKFGENMINWEGWWSSNRESWTPPERRSGAKSNIVTGVLDPTRDSELRRDIPADAIVVLSADCIGERCRNLDHNFDHIEYILRAMNIPHVVVKKTEFEKSDFRLDGRMMLLVNCNQLEEHCIAPTHVAGSSKVDLRRVECISPDGSPHIPHSTRLSDEAVEKIRRFVAGGGYLFTEDWELKEILARAWPHLIGVGSGLTDNTVKVTPSKGMGTHPYLNKIFFTPPSRNSKINNTGVVPEPKFENVDHIWKIDNESPSIDIKHRSVVTILESGELGETGSSNAVAVTFAMEGNTPRIIKTGKLKDIEDMRGGRVLHVLSHFGKQKSRKDEFAIQNLLINFLIEAMKRYVANNPEFVGIGKLN